MSVPFLACMVAAASFHHLPVQALAAIQSVEGGIVGTVSANKDGSADLGLMQVNTQWIPAVARATRTNEAVVRTRLVQDGCYSVKVAAAILDLYKAEAHGNILEAVGFYHSHTPDLKVAYQTKVLAAALRLRKSG
ncbi:MAG TPA: lytic transglycosylase domain-containing protein [Aliidongia sp.]|uniref:lytic transglycosylase domain-containing protein n=1 Tax=Aliidongia sp. TaxID=1914230 RepID=UPI002DDD8BB9|nr:lytic transglycosylase domain-containing protein [Aliidongia sp.]HEV2677851.1 lytic transglycosylase domain-containing protein [Aliidongia sp.]